MQHLIDTIVATIFFVAWISGFVLAKGFFSTLACLFPFWAFYLVIERLFWTGNCTIKNFTMLLT